MLHGLVGFTVDTICCRLRLGVYRPREVSEWCSGHCWQYLIINIRLWFSDWTCILLGCAATGADEQPEQSPRPSAGRPRSSGVDVCPQTADCVPCKVQKSWRDRNWMKWWTVGGKLIIYHCALFFVPPPVHVTFVTEAEASLRLCCRL